MEVAGVTLDAADEDTGPPDPDPDPPPDEAEEEALLLTLGWLSWEKCPAAGVAGGGRGEVDIALDGDGEPYGEVGSERWKWGSSGRERPI